MPVSEYHGSRFTNAQYTLAKGLDWQNRKRGKLGPG
jgi:hypothetical protein